MAVDITTSAVTRKTLRAATNSALREVVSLGSPNDTWTIGDGAIMTFSVRPAPGHPTLSFAGSSIDGYVTLIDGNTRQVMLSVHQGIWAGLAAGTYYYDLTIQDGGLIIQRMAGQIVVEQGIGV